LLFVPIAQIFLYLHLREALVWTLAYTLLLMLPFAVFVDLSTALVMALVFGGGFIFFGAVTTSFRAEQAARVEQLTIAEERSRIAREIHHSLGHHLTLLNVQLQAAAKLVECEPVRAASEIEKARAVVADALQRVDIALDFSSERVTWRVTDNGTGHGDSSSKPAMARTHSHKPTHSNRMWC